MKREVKEIRENYKNKKGRPLSPADKAVSACGFITYCFSGFSRHSVIRQQRRQYFFRGTTPRGRPCSCVRNAGRDEGVSGDAAGHTTVNPYGRCVGRVCGRRVGWDVCWGRDVCLYVHPLGQQAPDI